jgi:hypothetical protein
MSAGEFTKWVKKELNMDNPTIRINGKVVRVFRRIE